MPEGHVPFVGVVVVVGRPYGARAVVDGHRVVQHDVGRERALLDGVAVHERLEGGASLALGLDGAVELGIVEALAAHQGPDLAGLVFDHDHGSLHRVVLHLVRFVGGILPSGLADLLQVEGEQGVELDGRGGIRQSEALAEPELAHDASVHLLLDVPSPLGHGRIGGELDAPVHREVHDQPLVVEGLLAPLLLHVLADGFQVIGAVLVRAAGGDGLDPQGARLVALDPGDVALVRHGAQHLVPSVLDQFRAAVGPVAFRRLDHAGQGRAFHEVELPDVLSEVDACRRLHAVGAVAQVDFVEVVGQELPLGVVAFQHHGGDGFLDLAGKLLLLGQEDVLGQLLRQRGPALPVSPDHGVDAGAHRAPKVHAPMLVEPPVLDGDHRLLEGQGDGVQGDPIAALHEEFAEGHPVLVQHLCGKGGGDGLQVLQGRHILRIDPEQRSDGGHHEQGGNSESGEADQIQAWRKPQLGESHGTGKGSPRF